jgi:hypothetical protein
MWAQEKVSGTIGKNRFTSTQSYYYNLPVLLYQEAVFLSGSAGPASILKACASGGPARLGSKAGRPARDLESLHRPA